MILPNIRNLKVSEIECRPQIVKDNGCSLVLYKDARADMRILDETFGICGWERKHEVINGSLYCTVSIWDHGRKEWVSKQDVGEESKGNDFKEKSVASDAFKRACVNIGIGRELYTAPFIWINLKPEEVKVDTKDNKKFYLDYSVHFKVQSITYSLDREITQLVIVDTNDNVRFKYDQKAKSNTTAQSFPKDEVVSFRAKEQVAAPASTVETDNSLQNAFNTIVTFGKYNGRNLSFIYNSDHQYFNWLRDTTNNEKVKKACEVIEHAM